MIRTVRHSLSLLLSLAALALIPAAPAAVNAADSTARMELPAPDKTGGMPLMQALAQRRSIKTGFSGAALSPQQLSDLLWASWGVNRDGGRRTAPTAMNRQSFYFERFGNVVSVEARKGPFTKVDLGIVKCHFEIGAGKDNFQWMPEDM